MFPSNFGNTLPAGASDAPQAREGDEIGDLETNSLTFQAAEITSGARLQLFPDPWPQDKLPPPYASLISIASRRGILAAAGPSSLVITNTEKLRAQYISRRKTKDTAHGIAEDENKIRPLASDLTLSVPRVSHVAFNADESCLVIAAEEGGGLAVYDTQALLNGTRDPAFQLATNGTSIRHLVPNPSSDPSLAYYFGVVLTNGQFVLADLKARQLVKRADGSSAFHENVVCAAWSKLGKQIVAGLENGHAIQFDRQGVLKAQIPRPPSYESIRKDYPNANALPLASIAWLSNFEFLFVYTPFNPPPNSDSTDSVYFLVQGGKEQPFAFRRLASDPCMAFVNERGASHHFISRLNDWQPNLTDALIVSSSSSCDIGLLANFKQTGDYRILLADNESRKATMPMSSQDESADTTPVGVAFDFSVIEVAPEPIPSEAGEIPDSRVPLPALSVMGTDGALSIWWLVYDESIRQGTPYHSMIQTSGPYRTYDFYSSEAAQSVLADRKSPSSLLSTPSTAPTPQTNPSTTSPFGSMGSGSATLAPQTQSAFGTKPTFGAPSTPTFGKPTFGAPSTPSAFGASSAMGKTQSAWGTPAANSSTPINKPAFGSATPIGGSAFGQVGGMGGKLSPWASTAQKETSNAQSQPVASGFAKIGAQGPTSGFASFASNNASSPFTASAQQSKPSTVNGGSAFGQSSSPFAAAAAAQQSQTKPTFGQPSFSFGQQQPSPFAQQTPVLSKETTMGSTATLGSTGSGLSFGKPSGQSSFISQGSSTTREETMGDDSTPALPRQTHENASGNLFGVPSGGFKLGSTFKGDGSAKDDLPKPANAGAGLFGNAFGNALKSTEQKEPEPAIKQEPGTEPEVPLSQLPDVSDATTRERPLTSSENDEKPRLASSQHRPSADVNDAPLPPDFSKASNLKIPQDAPLPPDFSKGPKFTIPNHAPLPPDFAMDKAPKLPNDLPLPPDFSAPKAVASKSEPESDRTLAGSPPVDLGKEKRPSLDSKASESAEVEWEDEDEVSEEGEEEEEGEADEEDEGDEDDYNENDGDGDGGEDEESGDEHKQPFEVSDPAGLEAFKNRITFKSQKPPSSPEQSNTPPAAKISYTPAGMPRTLPKGPSFAPPANRPQLIPRSPSPVRSVTTPLMSRPDIHTDHVHPQIKATKVPPSKPVERQRMTPQGESDKRSETLRLEDEEDQRIRRIIETRADPIRELQSFLTHQEVVDTKQGTTGVPVQIQRVFRDIDTMIDVAGLNARHIDAFARGQEELRKPGSRTHEDLDDAKAWLLTDAGDLTDIVNELEHQLNDGKLENVPRLIGDASEHQHNLDKLRIRTDELRKQMLNRTDPKLRAKQDFAPLNAETQAQQAELRHNVAHVLKHLTEIEEKMSLLRADLATANSKSTRGNGVASTGTMDQGRMPTVESVINTIMKMTAMVEQRSGDIDLLEAQIRRLPEGLESLRNIPYGDADGVTAGDYEGALVSRMRSSRFGIHARQSSAGGSPSAFATPPPNRRSRIANGELIGMTPMFGLSDSISRYRTPPSTNVLGRSGGDGFYTPAEGRGSARKVRDVKDVSRQEVLEWERKRQRKKAVLEGLRTKVVGRGTKLVGVGGNTHHHHSKLVK